MSTSEFGITRRSLSTLHGQSSPDEDHQIERLPICSELRVGTGLTTRDDSATHYTVFLRGCVHCRVYPLTIAGFPRRSLRRI